MAGFAEDLNDYYSGINALGLLTAIVKLAEHGAGRLGSAASPSKRKAENELDDYRERLGDLRGAVRISLANARSQSERVNKPDVWLPPSEAQYCAVDLRQILPSSAACTPRRGLQAVSAFRWNRRPRKLRFSSRWACFPKTARLRSRPSESQRLTDRRGSGSAGAARSRHRRDRTPCRFHRPQAPPLPEHARMRRESQGLAAPDGRDRKGADEGRDLGNCRRCQRHRPAVP